MQSSKRFIQVLKLLHSLRENRFGAFHILNNLPCTAAFESVIGPKSFRGFDASLRSAGAVLQAHHFKKRREIRVLHTSQLALMTIEHFHLETNEL